MTTAYEHKCSGMALQTLSASGDKEELGMASKNGLDKGKILAKLSRINGVVVPQKQRARSWIKGFLRNDANLNNYHTVAFVLINDGRIGLINPSKKTESLAKKLGLEIFPVSGFKKIKLIVKPTTASELDNVVQLVEESIPTIRRGSAPRIDEKLSKLQKTEKAKDRADKSIVKLRKAKTGKEAADIEESATA